ncbi:hypothetical protein HanIR_Chr14g0678211 [Helianthus annuus]|nr:hypothetical protein HanIR_Chr14g0678211 [Helianthus annuus]
MDGAVWWFSDEENEKRGVGYEKKGRGFGGIGLPGLRPAVAGLSPFAGVWYYSDEREGTMLIRVCGG